MYFISVHIQTPNLTLATQVVAERCELTQAVDLAVPRTWGKVCTARLAISSHLFSFLQCVVLPTRVHVPLRKPLKLHRQTITTPLFFPNRFSKTSQHLSSSQPLLVAPVFGAVAAHENDGKLHVLARRTGPELLHGLVGVVMFRRFEKSPHKLPGQSGAAALWVECTAVPVSIHHRRSCVGGRGWLKAVVRVQIIEYRNQLWLRQPQLVNVSCVVTDRTPLAVKERSHTETSKA